MKCMNCKKGEMKESKTTYYKKVNGKYFIVENVPCFICEYCGEVIYNLHTLNIIETIISKTKEKNNANILTFDEAA